MYPQQAPSFHLNSIEDILVALQESEQVEKEILRTMHGERARFLVEDIQTASLTFRRMPNHLTFRLPVARQQPTSPASSSSSPITPESICRNQGNTK
jgi:hypothetical protein